MFKCVVYSRYSDGDKVVFNGFCRVLYFPFVPNQKINCIGLLRAGEVAMITDIVWDIDNNQFEARLVGGIDKIEIEQGIHPDWVKMSNKEVE